MYFKQEGVGLSERELSWYLASLPVTCASREKEDDRTSLEIVMWRPRAGANTSSCKPEGRKSAPGSGLMQRKCLLEAPASPLGAGLYPSCVPPVPAGPP